MTCIFCEIVRGEREAYIIYEDEEVMVFLDRYPLTRGHSLVVPKKHYEYIYDVPDDLLARLIVTTREVARAQVKGLGASGVRIVQNNGSDAGQIIFHVHFHVIPFYGEARRHRRVLSREEGEVVSAALREALKG